MKYTYTTYNNIKLEIYSPESGSDLYCVFKNGVVMGKIYYDAGSANWTTKYDNLKSVVREIGKLIDQPGT